MTGLAKWNLRNLLLALSKSERAQLVRDAQRRIEEAEDRRRADKAADAKREAKRQAKRDAAKADAKREAKKDRS